MTHHPRCAPPALRGAFALVLALGVAAVLDACPRAAVSAAEPPAVRPTPSFPTAAQPPKKEPGKKEPDKKEPDKKEPGKMPEIKWPTEIGGKDIAAVMKEIESTDPSMREAAVRVLPMFGPAAQKEAPSKLLLKRMRVEPDPGVRVAVYAAVASLHFEKEADNTEALRLLGNAVDEGIPGGVGRLNAVQAIAAFGPKGELAVTALTGRAMSDPSYETRRSIAATLGRVGIDEKTGPNAKALTALADKLARDESAAVRMEALQSLLLLGPPWAEVRKPDDKMPPKIETKSAEVIIKHMRTRVGDPKAKPPTPAAEKDKRVEIWARLVLMRFDPKEVNDENLDALARYLGGTDPAVKQQALSALGVLGEMAARKLNDVVRVLEEKDASIPQVAACVTVLTAMGAGAKPAIPNLRKMADKKKEEAATKKEAVEKVPLEELAKFIEAAIKHIEDAKPMAAAPPPPGPPKKP